MRPSVRGGLHEVLCSVVAQSFSRLSCVMRLRRLERQLEPIRGTAAFQPSSDLRVRHAIEGVVDLDRRKALRVVRQHLRGRQSSRDRSCPSTPDSCTRTCRPTVAIGAWRALSAFRWRPAGGTGRGGGSRAAAGRAIRTAARGCSGRRRGSDLRRSRPGRPRARRPVRPRSSSSTPRLNIRTGSGPHVLERAPIHALRLARLAAARAADGPS